MKNFFKFGSKKIKFTAKPEFYNCCPKPIPAGKIVPDWFKQAKKYGMGNCPIHTLDNGNNTTNLTVKQCVPFLDTLTAGYFILSWCDIFVKTLPEENDVQFKWTTQMEVPINTHDKSQIQTMPIADNLVGGIAFKFNTPWFIETPPGYSVLITHPWNRFEERWEIFTGIIDTDSYQGQINFPFIWKDKHFEGTIPAGTPIAQVIPFKREDWEMELSNEVPEKYKGNLDKLVNRFENVYRNDWWKKKKYK